MVSLSIGEIEGVSEDSRRTERAAVRVPAPGVRLSLPWHCLGEPPSIEDLVTRVYKSFSTQTRRSWKREESPFTLPRWPLNIGNGSRSGKAKKSEPRMLPLRACVLGNYDSCTGDEFGTPPRPPTVSVMTTTCAPTREGGPPSDVDRLSLHESFRDARAQGATISEAIALVASAYNIGPETVQLSVLGALEGQRAEEREPSTSANDPFAWPEAHSNALAVPAPPPPLPPGLTQDGSLVQAQAIQSENQFLTQGGGPLTIVAQLFPTSGSEPRPGLVSAAAGTLATNPTTFGLGQGLVRKAGASFGEQLGPSTPALATDRIIHAIDGLRKAQDEDKTGTKGQVSLSRRVRGWTFLARGCGQLSVELCKGVYGKELFHSIKRAGLHAKHELGLIKWPVLLTNRVALSIAGLRWGGTESFRLLASDCATARVEQCHRPSIR